MNQASTRDCLHRQPSIIYDVSLPPQRIKGCPAGHRVFFVSFSFIQSISFLLIIYRILFLTYSTTKNNKFVIIKTNAGYSSKNTEPIFEGTPPPINTIKDNNIKAYTIASRKINKI